MAEYNMTDKEQVEMIKKWWKDYGRTIAIALIIGLVVAFGWRYYRSHKIRKAQEASVLYGKLGVADSQKKPEVAEKIAAQLMKDYSSTPYATMAALWWAKAYVNEKNYNAALQKSEWALQNSHVKAFKQVARLRTVRILLFQKKPEAALDRLRKVDDKSFQPLIDEIKGDIYTAMNKSEEAAKAYKVSKAGLSAANINNPILDMKVSAPAQ